MRKLLSLMLCAGMLISCLGMLAACGSQGEQGAFGQTGAKGENGADGETPFIGTNGNWWIGSSDTGVAAQGPKGDKGDKGEPGVKGDKGEKGDSAQLAGSTENSKIKATTYLVEAAFSTPKLQMAADKEGLSYVFYDETGDSTVDINVIKKGNKFRLYASREIIPAENFSEKGYVAAGEVIKVGDTLTEFTYENKDYKTFLLYISKQPVQDTPEIEVFLTPGANETEKREEVAFEPWYCEDQPSALGGDDSFADGNWDANQIIENLYEPLRKKYPNYITRENIGKDSSGTYDMWKYVFTPASYNQTVYIQSGVHSREKAALLGLARFLEILCTQWESSEDMAYLYSNVRLVVVPIVNPWGVSQKSPKNDTNVNGVNLNKDIGNTTKQAETVNVLKVLDEYKDVLSCGIDYHSTVNATFGDYSIRYITNAEPNVKVSNDIVAFLAQKNVEDTPDLHYHGISTSPYTYNWYFWNKLGIPGCTVEHGDYIWDKSTKYSAVVMTRSVEFIGNVILNYARQEFKLHDRENRFIG